MPDHGNTLAIVLIVFLPLGGLLLLAVFLNGLRVSSRLRAIEQLLHELQESKHSPAEIAVRKHEQSEYEEFLNEDGKRRMLSKREQSEEFRAWRRQRGKTWGAEEHHEA
jgi:hypothetical protein